MDNSEDSGIEAHSVTHFRDHCRGVPPRMDPSDHPVCHTLLNHHLLLLEVRTFSISFNQAMNKHDKGIEKIKRRKFISITTLNNVAKKCLISNFAIVPCVVLLTLTFLQGNQHA